MCGRVSVTTPAASIAEFFLALHFQDTGTGYNITPSRALPVIRFEDRVQGRILQGAIWGLIPGWARDPRIGNKLSNARAETLAEKPSFRGAYKYRRCLVVVNGFYEWARQGSGKQPYYFHHAAHQLLAFAGLWEHWSGPMGEELTTCTIITCDANRLMAPIHHRMPVILAPEDIEAWLDPKLQKAEQVAHLLRPAPDDVLQVYKVGTHVNHSGNEGPRCIEPLDDAPPPSQQLNLF